ncbi:hypothetical protein, partial [Escherichia coli]|uniref:hypothetical protein n=1 Tax=Escherichia coli TaxID=562 RepID=UPI0019D5F070
VESSTPDLESPAVVADSSPFDLNLAPAALRFPFPPPAANQVLFFDSILRAGYVAAGEFHVTSSGAQSNSDSSSVVIDLNHDERDFKLGRDFDLDLNQPPPQEN